MLYWFHIFRNSEVFKARNRISKEFVALKRVLLGNEKEGFPITSLREIKILRALKHDNIVRLQEICRSKGTPQSRKRGSIYLVFEFCAHDLAGLLQNPQVKFNLSEIKRMMKHLLSGLFYIHSNKVLHRDLKAANVLVTRDGVLKLADFGLARVYSRKEKTHCFTNRVVTLWYRAPELLLGCRDYGPAIDMWAIGCIMAEFWTRSAIMQGNSETNQLTLITQLCGSITPEVYPDVDKLDLFKKFDLPASQKRRVKERLSHYVRDRHALDLIDRCLTIDPAKRIDSDSALNHDFFWSDPLPASKISCLSRLNVSMFEFLIDRKTTNPQHRPEPSQMSQQPGYDRVF
ncbi:Cyclin-dependent kinase 9 [Trichoplax sp. H2]|nr:Cyclin-dependent kinase 9 [Trichoplax sp. H2]|eukprot:RDD38670.1 Cyclin-dependent kinase 9 [Trichoplax sp. H2]